MTCSLSSNSSSVVAKGKSNGDLALKRHCDDNLASSTSRVKKAEKEFKNKIIAKERKGNRSGDGHSSTSTFQSTFEYQGDFSYIPVVLTPGQIVQATLITPEVVGLNYDLFLYEEDDGYLGDLVDYCDLDGIDDSIAYINNTNNNISLYVLAYATAGYNEEDQYALTISIDGYGYYDSYEPDENAFYANTVAVSGTAVITGRNLNVSNDQDWYAWTVPSTICGADIFVNNNNYSVDVYYTSDGTTMNKIIPTDDTLYSLPSDTYYIRVRSSGNSFTSSSYSLAIIPYDNTGDSMSIVSMVTDTTNNSAIYAEGLKYRAKFHIVATVRVVNDQGVPVTNRPVKMTWTSGAWNPGTWFYTRDVTENTNSSGVAVLDLTIPNAMGEHCFTEYGAQTFTHYYDIDTLSFECDDFSDDLSIYHLAYSI